jgi:hypothetical protein
LVPHDRGLLGQGHFGLARPGSASRIAPFFRMTSAASLRTAHTPASPIPEIWVDKRSGGF